MFHICMKGCGMKIEMQIFFSPGKIRKIFISCQLTSVNVIVIMSHLFNASNHEEMVLYMHVFFRERNRTYKALAALLEASPLRNT